jgi:hypothetical protein
MVEERRQRLDALEGWAWNVRDAKWENSYRCLNEYRKQHGTCRVPQGFKMDGVSLGSWVAIQRAARFMMSDERRRRLEKLDGWSWDPYGDDWESGLAELKRFVTEHQHCRVTHNHITSSGFKLGQWVTKQKSTWSTMPAERRKRLRALQGCIWKRRET